MQPACQNLAIVPGTTYRDTVRLMQPVFAYRDISDISGAPLRVTVKAQLLAARIQSQDTHGLSSSETPQKNGAMLHRLLYDRSHP